MANFYAYVDGTAGYETSEFVGYSPGEIVGTIQAILRALKSSKVDQNSLGDKKALVDRLASALNTPSDQLQVYDASGKNLFVMAPSGSLFYLTDNKNFSSFGNSSIFHGLFDVDSREYTPMGTDSLHITMLNPSLVSLIGWGADNYLYIGSLHADCYNPKQNLFGHVCEVLKWCQ